jgi:hypothetical protein
MGLLIGDLLEQQGLDDLVGRGPELAALDGLLEDGGPLVLHLYGIGGVGKSRLLGAFAARAARRGVAVVRLDGRSIEPTEQGFLCALAAALGSPAAAQPAGLAPAAAQLGALGPQVLLLVDTYERLRLLDTWLRQLFIPALEARVRVVLAGREPPTTIWTLAPGWPALFRGLPLAGLDAAAAHELLARAGVGPELAARVTRATRGHPLALQLAAATAHLRADVGGEPDALQATLAALTRLYLAEVADPLARQALQAAAVVRRTTLSLLRALLPDIPPHEAYERLAALPFVEQGRDGLMLHDAVHTAIAADLRANDPERYRAYRRAAWQQLRAELQGAGRGELWRYTADMLYLLETPVVRETFFPSGTTPFAVEPARPGDRDELLAIVARHDGPASAAEIARWWERAPWAFAVVRDRAQAVAGFYLLLPRSAVAPADLAADPVTRAWEAQLRAEPLDPGEEALFLRSMCTRDYGERFSEEQGALMLDLKRVYMELRPRLRRLYTILRDELLFSQFLRHTGFRMLPDAEIAVGEVSYHTAMLDFGPGSVDGWLTNLVAAELTLAPEEALALDEGSRELIVDGQRVGLTQLEFATLQYLLAREGQAVNRGDLLDDVWGYSYDGGSNVVDVVIRGLRKKLGVRASAIETVTRVGYRLRRPSS